MLTSLTVRLTSRALLDLPFLLMTDEPKLITHIAYAKRVNLDPEMLALALDAE